MIAEPSHAIARIVFAMTGAEGLAGGIATTNLNILHTLCDRIRKGGEKLTVLSLHEGSSARPTFLPDDVGFFGFGGNRFLFAIELLRLYRLDVLYVFDHVRLALPMLPFAAVGRVRMVILAHGSEAWRRVKRTSKWLYRNADLCVTNSHYTLRRMRETFSGFTGSECLLGLSPLHQASTRATTGPGEPMTLDSVDGVCRVIGRRMVLLVARMDPDEREKGHRELLEIWPAVLERYPDAQLVFAGPGEDGDHIRACIEQKNFSSSVFMPGYVPVEVLGRLYAHCYAFVMPSRQEGFGLVYLEAMNHGKPCIGCFGDGGEDVIVDGVTGILLHQPLSTQSLLAAVIRLFEDETAAAQMGRLGRQRLLDQFTSEKAQSRFRDRLESVLR